MIEWKQNTIPCVFFGGVRRGGVDGNDIGFRSRSNPQYVFYLIFYHNAVRAYPQNLHMLINFIGMVSGRAY